MKIGRMEVRFKITVFYLENKYFFLAWFKTVTSGMWQMCIFDQTRKKLHLLKVLIFKFETFSFFEVVF